MRKLRIGYDNQKKAISYNSVAIPVLQELDIRSNIDLIPFDININPKEKFDVLLSWALSDGCEYPQKVAYLPHGLSPWKGTRYRGKINHYFCCSTWEIGKYFNAKQSTYDIVGWPKLDYLVRNKKKHKEFREKLIRRYNLDSNYPIIAYLPTYTYSGETKLLDPNKNYSSRQALNRRGTLWRMLESDWPDIKNLILAPHLADLKQEKTRHIIDIYPYTYLEKNKNPLLLGCDIILGDISSILIESLVLDKPIVHLTNGHEDIFQAYKDHGHKTKCTLGAFTHNVKSLPNLINISLNTNKYNKQRQMWRDRFIYIPKETATIAVANAIERLAYKNVK